MSISGADYSPLKYGVIWTGIVVAITAAMVPITVMTNHYNDTERDRAVACIAQGGSYVDSVCSWDKGQ